MAMMLETIPRPTPVKIWIKRKIPKLPTKELKILKPGSKISNFGLKNKRVTVKSKMAIKAAAKPEIAPWTKNGPRINQSEAPTSFINEISSFEL